MNQSSLLGFNENTIHIGQHVINDVSKAVALRTNFGSSQRDNSKLLCIQDKTLRRGPGEKLDCHSCVEQARPLQRGSYKLLVAVCEQGRVSKPPRIHRLK